MADSGAAPFTLTHASSQGACPRCHGTALLHVSVGGTLVGTITSEWPWTEDIPDDPALHPQHPHYTVEWVPRTPEGTVRPQIAATTPYYIARAMVDEYAAQVADRS